jgi:hypothetical protein
MGGFIEERETEGKVVDEWLRDKGMRDPSLGEPRYYAP